MGALGHCSRIPSCWGWMEELLASEGPGSCSLLAGRLRGLASRLRWGWRAAPPCPRSQQPSA